MFTGYCLWRGENFIEIESSDDTVKAELPLPGFDMIANKGIPF
jgi:hypothetical protein